MHKLKFAFSTCENPRLDVQKRAINMALHAEIYFGGNSGRFGQGNALTVGLIEPTKQIKRVAFLLGSLKC